MQSLTRSIARLTWVLMGATIVALILARSALGLACGPLAVAQVEPLSARRCNSTMERHRWNRWSLVAPGLVLTLFLPWPGRAAANEPASSVSSLGRCDPALVHYSRYKGAGAGLAQLPWIAASPASVGLVGHLFYYDHFNAWKQKHLPGLRLYSGGRSPDRRINMKILWEIRRGTALDLIVRGRRLDGSGSFSQQLSSTSSNPRQFPSIINVPAPGCWRLTLTTGKTKASVSALVVR